MADPAGIMRVGHGMRDPGATPSFGPGGCRVPIYEYECRACGERFEALIRGSSAPTCPACDGADLERLLSLPRVSSDGTRGRAHAEAKKRRRGLTQELHASESDPTVDHHDDH